MFANVDHSHARVLRRSPYITTYAHMGEVYVYHNLTGFILKMSPDILAFLDEFEQARKRDEVVEKYAGAFGDLEPETVLFTFLDYGCLTRRNYEQLQDIWKMVPVKGRWNVWRRNDDGTLTMYAAWGDRPLTKVRLDAKQTAAWDDIDGETSMIALRDKHGYDTMASLVKELAHHDVQALKLSPVKLSFYKGRQHQTPPYLTSSMPYAPYDPKTDPLPEAFEAQLSPEGYYRAEIEDADAQFDFTETTLSHLFRRPHKALAQRTYGQAMIEALVDRWELTAGPIKVLEIGGGLGWVARHVTETLQGKGFDVTYDIMELSPTLAEAQRHNCEGLPITTYMGDCLSDDFPGTDYDVVISNEMIGDLTSVKLTREQLHLNDEDDEDNVKFDAAVAATGLVGELIAKHVIPIGDAPPEFYLNVGAWQLVERLQGVMKPGGHAIITEFGEMARYPILSTQLDHPELSIHFGHLTFVARSVGFEADFEFVMDLLHLDRTVMGMVTSRSYYKALTAMLAEDGVELDKFGYTFGMVMQLLEDKGLALNKDVGDIRFDRIEDRLMGLVPHEFKALMLTKRPADA
ncbi:MAG: hypothetical protein CSA66_01405 [Proteobacteria bacterium]|nr:MAG: hypothetical protein CSA66_01405 [Pseudomonadota bacterium]